MKLVKMFGPSISEPDKMVDRDVPEADVQAFRAAGYKEGSLPKDEKKEAVVNIVDETPKAEEDTPKAEEVKAPKAKKGKKK